ncbi:N-acetylmannosamine-6-phosphate 2-epimerase [Paenibacillus antarcticus]|uniref:Putative N-acetylmannosamine-6-phosphate 2-epimerase n=1 Tax=Paenibacillus antarcticus TaxID=253703 RepID=A0A162LVT3_9BACL|nr:N-acetylmannosamine-6-phosphate 2-epimerase [Paenibacillus antarcticus]OAB40457.1 N-acetylmannosamine-6-phosphate 2-epimerase [Paenibacillus antarcticus]
MNLDKLGLKDGLVVSCQALEHEPLHSSFIMGRMALAAREGGAIGIRANTAVDVKEIKEQVDLPVIGIVKRNYGTNPVFITPTIREVDELAEVNAEIIAVDATLRARPDGKTLDEFVNEIRTKHPQILIMADISTKQEAINAERLGFDLISTTLVGYTEETAGLKLYDDQFAALKEIISNVNTPVVAEGNIMTPEMAATCFEAGVYCVVVGGAITRPMQITERFVSEISKLRQLAPSNK